MRQVLLFTLLLFIVSAGGAFGQQQEVVIDSATNMYDDSSLKAGNTHVFQIRAINIAPASCATATFNPTNGFRVYSPDGATWNMTLGAIASPMVSAGAWVQTFENHSEWDGTQFVGNSPGSTPSDGIGPDGVGFGLLSFSATGGLPNNFNGLAYTIQIMSNTGDHSLHICVDTASVPGAVSWLWAGIAATQCNVNPTWAGPVCYRVWDVATSVDVVGGSNGLPEVYSLKQNYPNPFNPTTTISFDLPEKSSYTLKIFNVLGQVVEQFDRESAGPGTVNLQWDASRNASGVYFYNLVANDGKFVETKKMLLIR